MVMTDVHGKVVRWNSQSEHVFGYRSQDMVGRDLVLLMPAGRDTPRWVGGPRKLVAGRCCPATVPSLWIDAWSDPVATAACSCALAVLLLSWSQGPHVDAVSPNARPLQQQQQARCSAACQREPLPPPVRARHWQGGARPHPLRQGEDLPRTGR